MDLAELYGLNYRLMARWQATSTPAPRGHPAGHLAGLALRMFVELDPIAQRDALEYIKQLRNQSTESPCRG